MPGNSPDLNLIAGTRQKKLCQKRKQQTLDHSRRRAEKSMVPGDDKKIFQKFE